MPNLDNSSAVETSLKQPDGVHETAAPASQHQKSHFLGHHSPPTRKRCRLSGEERSLSLRDSLRTPSPAAARAQPTARVADPPKAAQTSTRRRRREGGSARAAAQCRRRPAGGSTARPAEPQPALAAGTRGPLVPRWGGGGEQPPAAALGRLAQAGGGRAPYLAQRRTRTKRGCLPQEQTPPAATAPLDSRRTRNAKQILILPGPQLPPSRCGLRYLPRRGRRRGRDPTAASTRPHRGDGTDLSAAAAPRRPIGQRRAAAPAGGAV